MRTANCASLEPVGMATLGADPGCGGWATYAFDTAVALQPHLPVVHVSWYHARGARYSYDARGIDRPFEIMHD